MLDYGDSNGRNTRLGSSVGEVGVGEDVAAQIFRGVVFREISKETMLASTATVN